MSLAFRLHIRTGGDINGRIIHADKPGGIQAFYTVRKPFGKVDPDHEGAAVIAGVAAKEVPDKIDAVVISGKHPAEQAVFPFVYCAENLCVSKRKRQGRSRGGKAENIVVMAHDADGLRKVLCRQRGAVIDVSHLLFNTDSFFRT